MSVKNKNKKSGHYYTSLLSRSRST